jgi:hypothetical protein
MPNGHPQPGMPVPSNPHSSTPTPGSNIFVSTPPNCQFVYHPAVFEMVTVSRERIESLVELGPSIYFGMFGIAIGIAVTAWTTILTVDLGSKTFAGFIGTAIATTILSIFFGIKGWKAYSESRDKLSQIFPKVP